MQAIDHGVSRYALSVVEGREVAGELVKLACKRHLDDLETGRDRGLFFDPQAADLVLNFAGLLQHTKGPLGGSPIALEPWQVFQIGSVYGWRREVDGLRRFRSTYNQVGKKNGKTTSTAVPLLFGQLFDGEETPEAYCAATNSKQAGILFEDLRRMVRKSPVLSRLMEVHRFEVKAPPTGGVVTTLSRDSEGADGINPSFLARDELHRWADREFADTITESMIARAQPIDWVITTAGQDRASICGELRDYAESVVRGAVADDAFFAYVAEPPQDADVLDPVAWKMGNPNLGVSKSEEAMQAAAEKALAIAANMPNFRRFHLDLWTEGAQTWIDRDTWDKGAAADPIDPRALFGRKAWVGLDLSTKTDTTAIVAAVPVDGLVYLLAWVFLPDGPKGFIHRARSEKREFVQWRDEGWLEVHKGGTIDEAEVVKRLEWIREKFDLQEVAFDPWGMLYLAPKLDKMGFPLVEHRQGFVSMSSPMKLFEERTAENRIRHGGNPVLAWQVGNVHRDEDASENVKPNKKKSTGRIDAAVAAIMAVGRAEAGQSVRREARDIG
ncbi:terminase TerL endonuclease subunit [uncultured Maritimibacter sp.]|jgi:phage terminase large subunit-like protein|uniref:terminase large subunit n=1 Tax=uncultured Maritimibacter sp. TaxID=991866 RepID=UPI000AE9BD71|nr:terminase TerL endonuclease subunit [uncultured Maritimibacter sp.]